MAYIFVVDSCSNILVCCAGVCDYRVLGNRSRSYLALDKLDEACQDAELACRLHPFWAKVQYSPGYEQSMGSRMDGGACQGSPSLECVDV